MTAASTLALTPPALPRMLPHSSRATLARAHCSRAGSGIRAFALALLGRCLRLPSTLPTHLHNRQKRLVEVGRRTEAEVGRMKEREMVRQKGC
jgi:hypothetical protein